MTYNKKQLLEEIIRKDLFENYFEKPKTNAWLEYKETHFENDSDFKNFYSKIFKLYDELIVKEKIYSLDDFQKFSKENVKDNFKSRMTTIIYLGLSLNFENFKKVDIDLY